MDLDKVGDIIVDNFKQALEEKKYKYGNPPRGTKLGNKVSSGRLKNSISAVSGRDSIQIKMEEYGIFVQGGRKRGDKGVPIDALLKWIQQRNIKSRDMTDRQLAFAIQRNIKKFGIRPSNWFDEAIDKMFDDPRFMDVFETTVQEEIDLKLEEVIDILEGI